MDGQNFSLTMNFVLDAPMLHGFILFGWSVEFYA